VTLLKAQFGRRWLGRDWEAYAGVVAAIGALVLHILHIAHTEVLVAVSLLLLALLLLRDLHREGREDEQTAMARETNARVGQIAESLVRPEAVLVGPRQLRDYSLRFARDAQGEMVWFNVCLTMFRPQALFDALLRPALENGAVTLIRFVLDPGERERWDQDVLPKARACAGFEKLAEPSWVPMTEAVSFVLADVGGPGRTEAQLSFWGEPFMARTPGRDVPRYMFHVLSHSDLVGRLVEMERSYRLTGRS